MILLVEDSPVRIEWFKEHTQEDIVITKDPFEAIKHLRNFVFGYLYLDHDLGESGDGELITVAPLVDYLLENRPKVKERIVVHSMNYPEASAMVRSLRRYGYTCDHIPYYSLTKNVWNTKQNLVT